MLQGSNLVYIARSKPTGLQPVSFEPPDSRENGRDDGVQAKRARGFRFEGSHDLVHEVPEEGTTGEDSRACARSDTSDLHGAGSGDRAGRYRQIIFTCSWQRHRFWRRQSWGSTLRGVRRDICRRSFPNCANNTGASTCGRAGTFARRWAQWMRQRSKPILRTSGGTKMTSRSRSLRPPSLEPALSRERFTRLEAQCDFQSPKDSTGFQPVVINRQYGDGRASGRSHHPRNGSWRPRMTVELFAK